MADAAPARDLGKALAMLRDANGVMNDRREGLPITPPSIGEIMASAREIYAAACTQSREVDYLERDLTIARLKVHPKYSCFYGPSGLLGVLNMYETFYKVHGSTETIMTVAMPTEGD